MKESKAEKKAEEATIEVEEPEPILTPFDISTKEGRTSMFELLCIARGVDPNQIQGMAKFMNPDSVDETTYYPNQLTSLAVSQLRMYGTAFYKGDSWNEYDTIADYIGKGFKGLKGFKSEQYKDITSGQPNLSDLKGLPEETQRGALSGLLSRGNKQ